MITHEKAVLYQDDFGFAEPGHVFYPPALGPVTEFVAELNREDIMQPKSFNANIELYLDLILGRFRSFHDTHRAAQQVHQAYRVKNRQYCLYLRSFALGGVVLGTGLRDGRLMQNTGWASTDRDFRKLMKASLPPGIESLSFINTFDLYPSGSEPDNDYLRQVTIPSFRVLSHNWKAVVGEVVRGAKCIVLNVQGATEGVTYELELIRKCGMTGRTLMIGAPRQDIVPVDAFYDLIDMEDSRFAAESAAAKRFAKSFASLATDGFMQTNAVSDLSDLRCWIVDRQIDLAAGSFDEETLADVPYDLYIPSSLAGNWNLLSEIFPAMIDRWQAIETRMGDGETAAEDDIAQALYTALNVFYVGVTLERYYEMAMALSIMGMAHRTITGNIKIMASCYRHAAQCARWLGDPDLAEFFADAHSKIEREMAAKGP